MGALTATQLADVEKGFSNGWDAQSESLQRESR